VLVDALMVESGRPRGLTGAFQAVQCAAIYTAAVLVGVLGGYLAERRSLSADFVLAALFALISFSMTLFVVHDPPARADRKAFRQAMAAVRGAVGGRDLWIGHVSALGSLAAVADAFIYAQLTRRVRLKLLINVSIGAGVTGLLAYLLYRDAWSAVVIDVVFGRVGMIAHLAFLDLAAKACPRRVEATFFALLMSVLNAGNQSSQVVGGYLYDWLGYTPWC
jgi:predicted MFS family arabinose efflux permease